MLATASFKIIKTVSEIKVQSVDLCVCVCSILKTVRREQFGFMQNLINLLQRWWNDGFFSPRLPPHHLSTITIIHALTCKSQQPFVFPVCSVLCVNQSYEDKRNASVLFFRRQHRAVKCAHLHCVAVSKKNDIDVDPKKPENINPKLFV